MLQLFAMALGARYQVGGNERVVAAAHVALALAGFLFGNGMLGQCVFSPEGGRNWATFELSLAKAANKATGGSIAHLGSNVARLRAARPSVLPMMGLCGLGFWWADALSRRRRCGLYRAPTW